MLVSLAEYELISVPKFRGVWYALNAVSKGVGRVLACHKVIPI